MKLLTGEPTDWKWRRTYGCNTAIAGEYLMTFRSGAAGFYDLLGDSGTGNLGGFKSGCTSNLIPANGVLNAPDYTRTCDCAYQNQSSLALIHTPEEEMWTFDGSRKPGTLGINFNAPGNRRGPDGTLWLDFPNEGGDKESLPVTLEPREPEEFRFHSSYVTAGDLPWVASSGFRGLQRVIVTAGAPVLPKGLYTLRLVFSEPEDVGPGERVFDVWCQGDRLIENLDIVKLAAGTRRTLIKEFPDIQVVNDLSLRFEAKIGGERAVVLCGMELIRRNND